MKTDAVTAFLTFRDFGLNSRKENLCAAQLKQFIESIGPDSIAIIPRHTRHAELHTEYKFRQDSDFAYLTGFPNLTQLRYRPSK